jgi:hypothetical protein
MAAKKEINNTIKKLAVIVQYFGLAFSSPLAI